MTENGELSNQHIFVTGGASPTGAAVVRRALLAGAKVSFVDKDKVGGANLEK